MGEPSHGILGGDGAEGFSDRLEECFACPGFRFPQEGPGLAPHHFDGVGVGAAGRQEDRLCSCFLDDPHVLPALVGREVVHDDEVSLLQCRDKDVFQASVEDPAARGGLDGRVRGASVKAHGGNHRGAAPAPGGRGRMAAQAFPAPSAKPGHVRFRPGFIKENKLRGVWAGLALFPVLPCLPDILPVLLAGSQRFFLKLHPMSLGT